MGQTIIEKILASHSNQSNVKPDDIVDITIDVKAARDFGGANVVKNIRSNNLSIIDPTSTFFTFDTNPTGSDQKYAVNQQICRQFAREYGIKIYDIDNGIGTHTMIHDGLVYSGRTAVTTDSHANILGAVGAFGQGMGDQDIAAAFAYGKIWFKAPASVKLTFTGERPKNISAKDIALNLLEKFGANSLLGYSVEFYGKAIDKLTLDERITIASMGTEMGAITLLFPPTQEILNYSEARSGHKIEPVFADNDANYIEEHTIQIDQFKPKVSIPGAPHNTENIDNLNKIKIDSAFIGSCTNGRIEDLRTTAAILTGHQIAPGVILKVVPSTNEVWQQALDEGIIQILKNAGALISNAGCAGCAAGQVGQNGEGEVTISTGNRNFPGKQGKGDVYLASPAVVAASAVAGYITTPDNIPQEPMLFNFNNAPQNTNDKKNKEKQKNKPTIVEGRAWYIEQDNIDTDMIFHNRYLAITDINEMGQYAFDNLEGYKDFASKSESGDIIITCKNFGSGSSRQQAVDCFKVLGIQAIVAKSFGAIYERNAINAAMPIIQYNNIDELKLTTGDRIKINFESGQIENLTKHTQTQIQPFSEVQMEIYQRGGLF